MGKAQQFIPRMCACSFEDLRQSSAVRQLGLLSSGHPETLVLYTYSNSDPEYERNLHFFVQYGMAEGDGCDYLMVVQQVSLSVYSMQSPLGKPQSGKS